MQKLLDKLNINETMTKRPKKPKAFTKVYDNIPHEKGYNYMADLLMLPTTKSGYKYCLVMVDLSTHEFDIEEMKNKNSEGYIGGHGTHIQTRDIEEAGSECGY